MKEHNEVDERETKRRGQHQFKAVVSIVLMDSQEKRSRS